MSIPQPPLVWTDVQSGSVGFYHDNDGGVCCAADPGGACGGVAGLDASLDDLVSAGSITAGEKTDLEATLMKIRVALRLRANLQP
jgi:hypothetical protein